MVASVFQIFILVMDMVLVRIVGNARAGFAIIRFIWAGAICTKIYTFAHNAFEIL